MSTGSDRERTTGPPSFAEAMDGFRLEETWSPRRVDRRLRAEGPRGVAAVFVPAGEGVPLGLETLTRTSARGRVECTSLPVEHRAVAELCTQSRSVAEVAALLRVPLGLARVLIVDMSRLGLLTVYPSVGAAPDAELMERVLSGLRRM